MFDKQMYVLHRTFQLELIICLYIELVYSKEKSSATVVSEKF